MSLFQILKKKNLKINANLEVLTSEDWIAHVDAKGALLKSLLTHPEIVEVRQIGLMLAVELESEERVVEVISSLLERGMIGFYFLSCRNAFRLAPPLCITEDQIKEAGAAIVECLEPK